LDSKRIARHALKVNLMFALLDKQTMPLVGVPAYLDRVGIYREFNALFFRLTPFRLAELLIGDLVKAGAVRISAAGNVVPVLNDAG
jgi:hypothetical protein